MARRKFYLASLCILVSAGFLLAIPCAPVVGYTDMASISHHQVIFYLVALEKDEYFEFNCSTYFNSTIHAFILTQRPTEDFVNPDGSYKSEMWTFVNCSDTGNKPNASLNITADSSNIFYIQFVQQDEMSDYLLINSTHQLTRYYIPFIAGYPIVETSLAVVMGLFISGKLIFRKKRASVLS